MRSSPETVDVVVVYSLNTTSAPRMGSGDDSHWLGRHDAAPTVQPQCKLNVHMIVEHPNQEGDTSNCVILSLLD